MSTTPTTKESSTKTRESAMLVLQRGGEAGRRWPLDRSQPLLIGRSEECDIALPDRQVSRFHAKVTWQGDGYEVEAYDMAGLA